MRSRIRDMPGGKNTTSCRRTSQKTVAGTSVTNLVLPDLPNVTEVKNVGIIVDHELKFKRHTRAHERTSLILRCFKSKDPFLLFKTFLTYVRPLLEYNCRVWSPCYISLIRQVVSFCSKRLKRFSVLHYCERLNKLGAETLETRRLKLDLVMFYNILHGFVDIDAGSLFDTINLMLSVTVAIH